MENLGNKKKKETQAKNRRSKIETKVGYGRTSEKKKQIRSG
jgi:hypothetical protein